LRRKQEWAVCSKRQQVKKEKREETQTAKNKRMKKGNNE
jgi:hypothetical protein